MENIGALAILLAFCFAIYAVVASLAGKWATRPFLVLSAERAVYCIWALLTTAAGILIYSLITGDYRLAYVVGAQQPRDADHLQIHRRGGADRKGRCCSGAGCWRRTRCVVVFRNRRKFRDMMPYVTAILMTTQTFFLILIAFVAKPFNVLEEGKADRRRRRRQRTESAAPILDHGDPSAHAVSGLRGIRGAVRVRDRDR